MMRMGRKVPTNRTKDAKGMRHSKAPGALRVFSLFRKPASLFPTMKRIAALLAIFVFPLCAARAEEKVFFAFNDVTIP